MTKGDVKDLFMLIADYYPRWDVWQEKLDNWHTTLKNCDKEAVFSNLKKYAKENKYPPTVADLYQPGKCNMNQSISQKIDEWERNALSDEEIRDIVSKVKWRNDHARH